MRLDQVKATVTGVSGLQGGQAQSNGQLLQFSVVEEHTPSPQVGQKPQSVVQLVAFREVGPSRLVQVSFNEQLPLPQHKPQSLGQLVQLSARVVQFPSPQYPARVPQAQRKSSRRSMLGLEARWR